MGEKSDPCLSIKKTTNVQKEVCSFPSREGVKAELLWVG
jgi:hypothetical protein